MRIQIDYLVELVIDVITISQLVSERLLALEELNIESNLSTTLWLSMPAHVALSMFERKRIMT
jgi:hypothetical protein